MKVREVQPIRQFPPLELPEGPAPTFLGCAVLAKPGTDNLMATAPTTRVDIYAAPRLVIIHWGPGPDKWTSCYYRGLLLNEGRKTHLYAVAVMLAMKAGILDPNGKL